MGKSLKTSEVAEFFGVSTRTVAAWKASGLPCESGGRGKEDIYDAVETHRWLLVQAIGDGAARDPEIRGARLKILEEDLKGKQLRYEMRRGRLYDAEILDAVLANLFVSLRQAWRNMMPRLYDAALRSKGETVGYYELQEVVMEFLFALWVHHRKALLAQSNLTTGEKRKVIDLIRENWEKFGLPHWHDYVGKQQEEFDSEKSNSRLVRRKGE